MARNNDRWSALSMQDRADLIKLYVNSGITNIGDIRNHYNSFETGGNTEGGWSEESAEQRVRRYKRYDPTGGLGPITQGLYVLAGGNKAKGEENEYWKAYLGLKNNVPKMNPNAKTSWDDKIEAEKLANGEMASDFYGTTPRMDLNIQAVADTLNTGKIYRNYEKYKKKHPDLPSKRTIKRMYETGKKILENPNTWQQVEGDNVGVKNKLELSTNEQSPLGMLADFGMMWDPKKGALYMHDTYDFPKFSETFVGDRPKEMKIRSKIEFDPKKGSKLLRDDLSGFYDYPEPITTNKFALGGDKNDSKWDIKNTISPTQYWEEYLKSTDKRGISPEYPINENEIVRRQAWAESAGNDKAESYRGAKGRYQIMPNTLEEYQKATGDIGDIYDPVYNRRVRDWEFNRYKNSDQVNRGEPTDSVKMGRRLAVYNYGYGNVKKALNRADSLGTETDNSFDWLKHLPKETQDYVNFILRNKDTGAHRTNNAYKNRKK